MIRLNSVLHKLLCRDSNSRCFSFAFFLPFDTSCKNSRTSCVMDFLQSLNVDDLPEQQTRTSHLEEEYPDFDLKVGFDCCCTCGKTSPTVSCTQCQRVMYCSDECRQRDTDSSYDSNNNGGDDQAMGHSSVICALLALCNDDEIIEEGDDKEIATLSVERRHAAEERVASEYESYPATIANAVSDIPCFQDTLQRCRRKQLTIHVMGASEDAELWRNHPNSTQRRNVWQSYADAVAETAENFELTHINLHFVGPECPKKDVNENILIPPVKKSKSMSCLHISTSRSAHQGSQSQLPDILIFFNPGFTCPDYDWESTVAFMRDASGLPFLVTTNTELEAIADLQFLWDRGLVEEIPAGLTAMLEGINGYDDDVVKDSRMEDVEEEHGAFLTLNPFSGMRVRQNGTMANDVYVKSRWIFGGLAGSPEKSSRADRHDPPPKKKTKSTTTTKKSNPALV